MDRIMRTTGTLLIVGMIILFPSAVRAQQAPINCKGPLSEEQLIGLLKGGVADVRVQAIVKTCGIGFPFTPDVERRLRAAGASDVVIAEARRQDETKRRQEEERLWAEAKDGRSAERLQEYLKRFPDGQHVSEAREKLAQLKRLEQLRTSIRQAKKEGRWQESESWLQELSGLQPEDEEMRSWESWIAEERSRALEARKREEEALWEGARDGRSAERLEQYLRRFPDGDHASEARENLTKLKEAEELRGKIRLAKQGGQWQDSEALLKKLAELSSEDEEMRSWESWVTGERARWDSMTLAEAKQEVALLDKEVETTQVKAMREVGLLETRIEEVRRTVEQAQEQSLREVDKKYQAEWDKAGQVPLPDDFTTREEQQKLVDQAKERQRSIDVKREAEKEKIKQQYAGELEQKTQANKQQIEQIRTLMEKEVQTYRGRIELLKGRTYWVKEASAEYVRNDPDNQRLTLKIAGEEYLFQIAPKAARDLVGRLSAVKVEQYLGEEKAQERVLVDTATAASFSGILRTAEEERHRRLALVTWTDPQTKLMWPLEDNGLDVDWHEATSYCQQLRLGGFSDWRLPEIRELEGIYDSSSKQPYKVKNGIKVSGGWTWSATKAGSGSAWYFLIYYGERSSNLFDLRSNFRALCVRRSRE
jgi:hypothetical protein